MEPLKITIGEPFKEVASKFLDHEALIDLPKGIRLTYREFSHRVDQLAKGLLKLGFQKGDPLALWAPNRGGMSEMHAPTKSEEDQQGKGGRDGNQGYFR